MSRVYYYVLLKIEANEQYFLEVGLDYILPFHPNITDEIEVMGYPSKIVSISYDLDEPGDCTVRLKATESLLSFPERCSQEDIQEQIEIVWDEIKEWHLRQHKRVVLNDYYTPNGRVLNV